MTSKSVSAPPARTAAHPENLKQALHLAGRGLRVFPLLPDMKRPAFAGWQAAATTDLDAIRAWYEGAYSDSGVGVATGQGVFVVDADGPQGRASLAIIESVGPDLGLIVDTPSGGRHAYFTAPDGQWVPNSVKSLADYPGIDIRGDGGFVAAPGSSFKGKPYILANDADLPSAPEWLIAAAVGGRKQREKAGIDPLVELDMPPAIARAIEYLVERAPGAVAFAGGDDTTYKIAGWVKDLGISEFACSDLMLGHWNETKADPPWDPDKLMSIVANAYAYGTSRPGVKDAAAEFDAVEIAEKPTKAPKKKRELFLVDFWESVDLALANPAPFLIKSVLNQFTFGVLYGPSNSGKTFLALALAYHIAAGMPWEEHKVVQGAVAYVAAEGNGGIHSRVAALNKHFAPGTHPPLGVIPCPIDLLHDDVDANQIVKLAEEHAASKGMPLRLIVIDTLSRALAGGDENSSVDMGKFIMNIDRLRAAANCAVLVVHHTGKNVANGARGWSGLRAAIDTEIEISEDQHISFEKQRDGKKIEPLTFALKEIQIGHTPAGDEITSCVLEVTTAATAEMDGVQIAVSPEAQGYLDVLSSLVAETGAPITGKEWDAEYAASRSHQNRPVVRGGSLGRLRKTLIESGWVVPVSRTTFTTTTPSELETAA